MRRNFFGLLALISSVAAPLSAKVIGQVDVGATYAHLEVDIEGIGKNKMDMYGVQAQGAVLLFSGFILKPGALYVKGDNGCYSQIGSGLGFYVPLGDFSVMPTVGVSYSWLESDIAGDIMGLPFFGQLYSQTTTPYVGADFNWMPHDRWRITATVQHGWAASRSKLRGVPKRKQESSGMTYALQVDYRFSEHWSVNAAAAHSLVRDKEKHGVEGKGLRLGLAYKF